ncbi:hypothetical protein C8J56DRAFT_152291 [Mycena floridula]|nr:hypothetical protein C8J56DRAFT_152291 [Mycena floridula]
MLFSIVTIALLVCSSISATPIPQAGESSAVILQGRAGSKSTTPAVDKGKGKAESEKPKQRPRPPIPYSTDPGIRAQEEKARKAQWNEEANDARRAQRNQERVNSGLQPVKKMAPRRPLPKDPKEAAEEKKARKKISAASRREREKNEKLATQPQMKKEKLATQPQMEKENLATQGMAELAREWKGPKLADDKSRWERTSN